MNVRQLHDLLTEAIQEGKGGNLVLMTIDDVDGNLRMVAPDPTDAFVQAYGNGFIALNVDEPLDPFYENHNTDVALILMPDIH